MPPRTRTILVAAIAAVLAVVASVNLAHEGYLLVVILTGLVFWVAAEWIGGPLPEAWVLAVVLFGYLFANRGFAQLSLSSRLPLLPAEAALLVCVPAILFRAAHREAAFLRRDPINYALLLWIILGAARLPVDLPVHGAMALRDFAMVYYGVFFFVGQGLGTHPGSRTLLGRALTLSFLLLPPAAMAFRYASDFFTYRLTFRDVPLIFHKGDLIATSLVAGFFWLYAKANTGRRAWLIPALISLGSIAFMLSPRAAMVAACGVTLLWLLARQWRILAVQGSLLAGALIAALAAYAILTPTEFRRTPFFSAYEHAISIFDLEGKGTYWNRDSGDPGGNNRFRLIWWNAVYRETMDHNPAFGLGFGHDLSARFLVDYEWLTLQDFSARSPHSMLFTMIGRMGLSGLALWLLIAVFMARKTLTAFRQRHLAAMSWWSVSWTFWFSSCFGVVLEGPMGAVVFWTTAGIANAQQLPAPAADPQVADLPEGRTVDEVASAS